MIVSKYPVNAAALVPTGGLGVPATTLNKNVEQMRVETRRNAAL